MANNKYKEKDRVEFTRGPYDGRKGTVKFVTAHGKLLVDLGDGSDVYCNPEDVKPALAGTMRSWWNGRHTRLRL